MCKHLKCNLKAVCKGYCYKHYTRWKRWGDSRVVKKAPNGSGYISKQNGYRYITVKGRRVSEHQHVVEKHFGRQLKKGEVVHHINENRLDNRLENLKLMSIGDHLHYHNLKNPIKDRKKVCAKCKKKRLVEDFFRADTRDGKRSMCRLCDYKRHTEYYHQNKFKKPNLWGLDLSRLNKST